MMEKKQNLLAKAVATSVSESVENMVFMAVEPMRLIWGKVPILAPVTGAVTVAFPEGLVDKLVGELHTGLSDPKQKKAILMDTVAEMTNTIAGRMMNLLIPENEEFEIGLPKTGVGDVEYKADPTYIQHFEIQGAMYAVVLEGRDLLEFRNHVVEPEPQPAAGGWGA